MITGLTKWKGAGFGWLFFGMKFSRCTKPGLRTGIYAALSYIKEQAGSAIFQKTVAVEEIELQEFGAYF